MELFEKWTGCWVYCLLLILNISGHISVFGLECNCSCHVKEDIDGVMCDRFNGTILDCSSRGLTQVTVAENCSIFGLNVSNNRLTEIPDITGIRMIEWIDLSHNEIKFLHKKNFERLNSTTLKSVDLSYNGVLILSTQLTNILPNLQIFNLSNNVLGRSSFELSVWKLLPNLKLLDVRNNSGDLENSLSSCDLGEEGGVILLDSMNCCLSCVQSFLQRHCEFDQHFSHCLESINELSLCQGNISNCRRCDEEETNITIGQCNVSVPSDKQDAYSTTFFTNSYSGVSSESLTTRSNESTSENIWHKMLCINEKCWLLPAVVALTCVILLAFLILTWKCYRRMKRAKRYDKWISVYTPKHIVYPSLERVLDLSDMAASNIPLTEERPTLGSRTKSQDIINQHSIKRNRTMIRKQTVSLPVPEFEEPAPKRILSWI